MDKKARANIIKKARTVDVSKTTMTHPFGITGTPLTPKRQVPPLQGPNVSSRVVHGKGISNLLSRLVK
jgi:hypothetical protein